jgi:hypothetical protein
MKSFQSRQCFLTAFCIVILIIERFDSSEAFLASRSVHQKSETYWTPLLLVDYMRRDASLSDTDQMGRRVAAQRWNGNHKSASKKLCDVTKAKKLILELSVQRQDGSMVTKTVLKKKQETLQHVLTKAMMWKLYCDDYQFIEIEKDIGDQDYLPDVVSLDNEGRPLFWGESGRMKVHKAVDLMKRYPEAHIVHCRWDMELSEIEAPLMEYLQDLFDKDALGTLPDRTGRFTFFALPLDVWRFIDEETGIIHLTRSNLESKELIFPKEKTIGS